MPAAASCGELVGAGHGCCIGQQPKGAPSSSYHQEDDCHLGMADTFVYPDSSFQASLGLVSPGLTERNARHARIQQPRVSNVTSNVSCLFHFLSSLQHHSNRS
jgi:hypothetical protein